MTSCTCGAQWSGYRVQHCPVAGCHQTFSGETAGNMHRAGDHAVFTGPNRRRCLTKAEMVERGMDYTINAQGTWIWGTGKAMEAPFYVSPLESDGLPGDGWGNVPPRPNEAVSEMGVG